jgi:serine/threonine-protein kinase
LEELVMACLAKRPEDRPQTIEAIEAGLRDAVPPGLWSQRDSREWWSLHAASKPRDGSVAARGPDVRGRLEEGPTRSATGVDPLVAQRLE